MGEPGGMVMTAAGATIRSRCCACASSSSRSSCHDNNVGGRAPPPPRVSAQDILDMVRRAVPMDPRDHSKLQFFSARLEERLRRLLTMASNTSNEPGMGPTKKQVEEVVRAVFQESRSNDTDRKRDPEWVDQLVDFVQMRLSLKNDTSPNPSQPPTPTDSTCTSSTVSTPRSEFSDSPDFISAKPYQATVEDAPEECSVNDAESSADDDDSTTTIASGQGVKPTANSCRRRPTPGPFAQRPLPKKPQGVDCPKVADVLPGVMPSTRKEEENPSHKPAAEPPSPRRGYLTPPSSRPSSPKPRPTVHFSDRPMPKLHHRDPPRADPAPEATTTPAAAAAAPAQGLSDLDLQWGRLFTGSGEPTVRLRQILYGLANYINDEFEPRGSTLITPDKLYSFYRRFRLEKELYPFQRIFDTYSRKSLHSLKCLYQDLRCDYYLIHGSGHPRDRAQPPIPGLTADGFADWMANFMQATPDIEARRLSRVAASLPIEVPFVGGARSSRHHPPERLPRQLSRHLFPSRPHERLRQRVSNSVMEWDQAMQGYADPSSPSSPSSRTSPSWTAAFCDAIARSLSPSSRDYADSGGGSGHRRRYNYPRSERPVYVEVPSSTGGGHHHSSARGRPSAGRSSRYHQASSGGDDRDDDRKRPSRDIITTYVEAEPSSRRRNDRSPHGHRDTHMRDRGRSLVLHPQESYRYVEPSAAVPPQLPPPPPSALPAAPATSCAPTAYCAALPPPPPPVGVSSPTLNRADNYALFQGRRESGPGPTYEEFLRERDTAAHSRRPRYGG
ncbi:hypothetical protein JDV02_002561 [Purpureocillium takamizusanense]|uniref:DUF7514 domain-containing protein n=1 Tax=Purpureocillium takamizusanense TaxID=2060973 RepID=A0A9Q8Q8Y1_9HYPO|nr:uncharacterized protein JDV02_002561 [Purpureocillium takamizusanense]UNI16089.1 hypothetical protein JDV02_002561 [Purpureocillium takamizusanense]